MTHKYDGGATYGANNLSTHQGSPAPTPTAKKALLKVGEHQALIRKIAVLRYNIETALGDLMGAARRHPEEAGYIRRLLTKVAEDLGA